MSGQNLQGLLPQPVQSTGKALNSVAMRTTPSSPLSSPAAQVAEEAAVHEVLALWMIFGLIPAPGLGGLWPTHTTGAK
jgi:hypothetical protein